MEVSGVIPPIGDKGTVAALAAFAELEGEFGRRIGPAGSPLYGGRWRPIGEGPERAVGSSGSARGPTGR